MPTQVMIGKANPKGNNTAPNHQDRNKVPLGHQLQEVEGAEASEEDTKISPGDCSVYSAGRIKDIQQGHAKS